MRPRYTVTPLDLGEAEVGSVLDVFWSLTTDTSKVTVPILGFLIEGGESPIVVDTGMRDPDRATTVHKLGRHRRRPDQTLPAALAKHGITPEDVGHCVLTHLHYDHAGACELLPGARFHVQRSELSAAATPMGPRTLDVGSGDLFYDRLDVAQLIDPLWDRVELYEGDVELFPGIRCVLYADSHTPGSQCIYVDTDDGVVVLVGDIVRKVELNVDRGIPPGLFYGLEQMRRALLDIDRRADVVWPTHDPGVAALAR